MNDIPSPISFNPSQEMSRENLQLIYFLDHVSPHVEFHAHPFYEIYYFLEGSLECYVVGGRSYRLLPGDILMIPPGIAHHPVFMPETGAYRRYVLWLSSSQLEQICHLDPDLVEVFELCQKEENYRIRCTSLAVTQQLEGYLRVMWQEEQSDSPCKQAYLYSLCVAFLVLLQRAIAEERALTSQHRQAGSLLDKLLDYINENYASPISLNTAAERFYTSPSNIEQLFTRKLGKPFYLYVTECRIIHAQSLISSGMPLKDVASACGYNDYSNFYRAFTRVVGISPSRFRHIATST